MEKYDVAIIGGGSAGLAALKQLSTLGKQAVLLEAGGKVGVKNISGGILYSKKLLPASQSISSTYMIPARVIGTSGSKISPMLYVAAGISGAMQHVAGMQDSEFVVAINPDIDSPIKNECDIFINGRMEDVIPLLVEELKKQQQVVQAG